jgi:microsomal epoxide hydrolase
MKMLCLLLAFVLFSTSYKSTAATSADGFVDVAGHVRIHYLKSGCTTALHTLLLIPGWRISSSIWSKQIAYFSVLGYRVFAMDSRSQGESSVVTEGNAPENRAADIQQLITKLRMSNVVMVGWSQGAQDVAAYVNRYGTGTVDGLVLVDSPVSTGHDDVTDNPGFLIAILKVIATYSSDPRGYSDGMMHAIISTPTPPEVYEQLDKEALKTPSDIGISMLIQDMFSVDRRPALKQFSKPTLVIASGKSPLLDEQRNMLKTLPDGKFVVVADAAHAVFFDQPDVFNHELATFVASLDARHRQSVGRTSP